MLTRDQLLHLTQHTADTIEALRADDLPGDAELIAIMEQTFGCLRELDAWRRTYPDQRMARTFNSPFGQTTLQ